jgi:uncharacterized membrane protein
MKQVGRIFVTGIFTVLPILATVYLVIWLFTAADHFLGKPLLWLIPDESYRQGMGFLLAIVVIFVVGALMRAYVVRQLFGWAERLLMGIPLVKSIYGALRDLFGLFAGSEDSNALQVVSVKLPGSEMRILGFVTREDFSDLAQGVAQPGDIAVYLPMSYQVGGYTVFVPRNQVEPVGMSREDAMRFVLTAGIRTRPADGA